MNAEVDQGRIQVTGGTPDESAAVREHLHSRFAGRLATRIERAPHGWRVLECERLPPPGTPQGSQGRLDPVSVEDTLNEGGFSVISDNSYMLTAGEVKMGVHRESSTTQRRKLQEFLNLVPDSWGGLRFDITITQGMEWSVATLSDPFNYDPRLRSLAGSVPKPRDIVIAAFEAFGIKAVEAGPFVFSRRTDLS